MDELKIHNFVIHKIEKEQNGAPKCLLSDHLVDDLSGISKIANKLDGAFTKRPSERAVFSSDSKFVSQTNGFRRYNFLQFTRDVTVALSSELTNATKAKGGYFVFFEGEKNDKFFFVFLVRDVQDFAIQQTKGGFKPREITHIDLNSVAMGARINISQYESGNKEVRYIILVKGNTDIAGYFATWIGAEKRRSDKQDCNTLLKILNKIALPEKFAAMGDKDGRDALREKVAEQIKLNDGIVDVRKLSHEFFGDENRIQEHAEKHAMVMNSTFPSTRSIFKALSKIIASKDGIGFSAVRRHFTSQKIRVEGNLLIIDSPELINEINQQR